MYINHKKKNNTIDDLLANVNVTINLKFKKKMNNVQCIMVTYFQNGNSNNNKKTHYN